MTCFDRAENVKTADMPSGEIYFNGLWIFSRCVLCNFWYLIHLDVYSLWI